MGREETLQHTWKRFGSHSPGRALLQAVEVGGWGRGIQSVAVSGSSWYRPVTPTDSKEAYKTPILDSHRQPGCR